MYTLQEWLQWMDSILYRSLDYIAHKGINNVCITTSKSMFLEGLDKAYENTKCYSVQDKSLSNKKYHDTRKKFDIQISSFIKNI